MRKSKFSESQIVSIYNEADSGIPVLLGKSGRRQDVRHEFDDLLQSQPSEHSLGRFNTEAAVGHGRLTLLLIPLKKGRITGGI